MTVGIQAGAPTSMRLSSRTHYGLRMMTQFAEGFGGAPQSLAGVARAEQLPPAYTEQLAAQLRRAGLLVSTRGVHGGYSLARSPEAISVLDVISAVEGEVAPVECVAHDYQPGACSREGDCASRPLWRRLKQSIDRVLGETSLRDLIDDRSLMDDLGPSGPDTLEAPSHG